MVAVVSGEEEEATGLPVTIVGLVDDIVEEGEGIVVVVVGTAGSSEVVPLGRRRRFQRQW